MVSAVHRALSITEITRKIKQTLTEHVGNVVVEGEISNIKCYSSGHTYFVLKDESAQLNVVLFKSVRDGLANVDFLVDGQKVRADGAISVFEGRGQYQLVVHKIESAGIGDLLERYEQLKKKLQAEGLFDDAHKKALPLLPRRIGIVTSPTGAVIHDIVNVLRRRFPNMSMVLAPVKVQGAGAADSIAKAIRWFNASCGKGSAREIDVLIVGRGGGSIEDLWAFNEEIVARAIYNSEIPVISAVGHAVDYTLCDFVADLRAPTPSAAAELAVKSKADFENLLCQHSLQMERMLMQRSEMLRNQLHRLANAPVLTRPEQALARYAQRVDHLEMRLQHVIQREIAQTRTHWQQSSAKLDFFRERWIANLRSELQQRFENMRIYTINRTLSLQKVIENYQRQLQLLNPLKILDRGYSLTRAADGSLIRSVTDVSNGAELLTLLKDGTIKSTVQNEK